MPEESSLPTLQPGRYQTFEGQPVILVYRLREHWYGYLADRNPERNSEQWHQDGTHLKNPDWNLKIPDFED